MDFEPTPEGGEAAEARRHHLRRTSAPPERLRAIDAEDGRFDLVLWQALPTRAWSRSPSPRSTTAAVSA